MLVEWRRKSRSGGLGGGAGGVREEEGMSDGRRMCLPGCRAG